MIKHSEVNFKSHVAVWATFAKHFELSSRSIASFEKRALDDPRTYLTVLLPSLGKDFDTSLDYGKASFSTEFFKLTKFGYPIFLKEIFSKVFDQHGQIRHWDCDIGTNISKIRQLLFMFYKYEFEFSPSESKAAYDKFIATDDAVQTEFTLEQVNMIRKDFLSCIPEFNNSMFRHSNGATADKRSHITRRMCFRYDAQLASYFDYTYAVHNREHWNEQRSRTNLDTALRGSKVTLVPKDSRGPRIICMEPHEYMFFQQGLMGQIYDYVESSSPARGHVNFRDQGINRDLTYTSSIDTAYATIDLKDASDMVSLELIQLLLASEQDKLHALMACRSPYARVDGKIRILKKFAPMGSALCFPIEAILFWSICRTITADVYVYGDDIIVPTDMVQEVMMALESYGLLINRGKSLFRGFFRESCGAYYYKGHDVSIVKLNSFDKISFVAFLNNIRDRYDIALSDSLSHTYERTYSDIIQRQPLINALSATALVYYTERCSSFYVFTRCKYNERFQKQVYLVESVKSSTVSVRNLDGYDGLFTWLSARHLQDEREVYEYTSTGDKPVYRAQFDGTLPVGVSGLPKTISTWGHVYNVASH